MVELSDHLSVGDSTFRPDPDQVETFGVFWAILLPLYYYEVSTSRTLIVGCYPLAIDGLPRVEVPHLFHPPNVAATGVEVDLVTLGAWPEAKIP
jgi:hypothetical protein